MFHLTFDINENGQSRSQTFSLEKDTKTIGVILIGRNSKLCDLVLNKDDKKVSRLHAKIFLQSDQNTLYIQNLTINQSQKKPNFLSVNGQVVIHQKVQITSNSLIKLGRVELKVTLIDQPQKAIKCPDCGRLIPYSYKGYFCPHSGSFLESGETVDVSSFQHF